MPIVKLDGFSCLRCGWTWLPRNVNEPPVLCPCCRSGYWNKEYVNYQGRSRSRPKHRSKSNKVNVKQK
jgi:hypothetical protein